MTHDPTLVARAERWLADNPDAPVRDRAACAIAALSGGDIDQKVSFERVAELLEVDLAEVLQALFSAREKQELVDEQQGTSTAAVERAGRRLRAKKHGRRRG